MKPSKLFKCGVSLLEGPMHTASTNGEIQHLTALQCLGRGLVNSQLEENSKLLTTCCKWLQYKSVSNTWCGNAVISEVFSKMGEHTVFVIEGIEQWLVVVLLPCRACHTMVVPQYWLWGWWRLAEVTVLDPGRVLQIRYTGDSRAVHVGLVTGEPAREVERRGWLCPLCPCCSVCRLTDGGSIQSYTDSDPKTQNVPDLKEKNKCDW